MVSLGLSVVSCQFGFVRGQLSVVRCIDGTRQTVVRWLRPLTYAGSLATYRLALSDAPRCPGGRCWPNRSVARSLFGVPSKEFVALP